MSGNDLQIYLDCAATTPCDARVLSEMFKVYESCFGNPNSLHIYGESAASELSFARSHIANLVNSNNYEIVFTSGATESINIALSRTIAKMSKGGRNHLITFKTEHKATLDAAKSIERSGFDVDILDVLEDGTINYEELSSKIKSSTAIISVCYVNNETGTMQDVHRLIDICRKYDILLHLDATQAFGKVQMDVKSLDIDMFSASGHKIYGPKGVGILYCRKNRQSCLRTPLANLDIEYGIRSGTVPVPLCVGIGVAAKVASECMEDDYKRIKRLRDRFVDGIRGALTEIYINGSEKSNYPGIVNMSFRGCEGEALMKEADEIAVASGSACTSNKLTISHVLDAMRIPHDIAQSSLRITIGRYTTDNDIDIAIESLVKATNKLRSISPIWEMIESGVNIDEFFKNSIYNHGH